MKRTLLFYGLLFLTLLGCKSQQYTPDELPDKQLVFGYGGGMAGTVNTYILLENGQLFHTNSLTQETEELEPLSKKKRYVHAFLSLKNYHCPMQILTTLAVFF
ncbi:hypothetical protein N9Y48_04745 [Zobellia sp.]|nr:hypothetical protein [Zobellia sp.]